MDKKKIDRFVMKFFPKGLFKTKFISDKECEQGVAAVDSNHIIYINRKEFPKLDTVAQRATLLHEIGHLFVVEGTRASEHEYRAHIIALSLASSLNLKKEYSYLEESIRSWSHYGWNEERGRWRSHIIASKKFIQEFGEKNGRKRKTS